MARLSCAPHDHARRRRRCRSSKSFGATAAVAELSFEVAPGEIYGLLGPNGAGKTTTLRILAGILLPTRGRVRVVGLDVARDPLAVRQRLGFLTNTTGLYPRLTGRELLALLRAACTASTATRPRRASRRWRDALELGRFFDRRCEALSTGERQRLSIARAVLHDPAVLVLDEPTAGLDVLASRFLRDFVRAERDRGKAVVFSTHYLAEAELLCDRIGLLHRGRLLAEGTPAALRAAAGDAPSLEEAFLRLVGASTRARRQRRRRRLPERTRAMKLADVMLVAGKELRETLRDRRTLAVMVLFPLVVYPLVSLATVQVLTARIGRAEKAARARGDLRARGRLADKLRARLAARNHDGKPDFALSLPPAPATAADVRAGRVDAAIAGRRPPGARGARRRRDGARAVRRDAGTLAHRARRASRRRWPPALDAGLRAVVRGHRRRGRAAHRDGRLPAVEDPAARDRRDGDAGRVPSRHRHHRRRARARHAGDDAVGADRARRSDDRARWWRWRRWRRCPGVLNLASMSITVLEGAQAGGRGRGAVAALGQRRRRGAAGDPARRVPVRVGHGRDRRARAQLQGGADAADAGVLPVHGAGAAGGAGRLRARAARRRSSRASASRCSRAT